MLVGLIKRMLGTSDEHKAADERYKKRLEELSEREAELDALGEQLHSVSAMQKEKQEDLRKTGIDLTATLSRSLTPPDMRAVTEDEQDDEERHSGETVTVS